MTDHSLLENLAVLPTELRIFWPAAFDPEQKIAGPLVRRVPGNYWVVDGDTTTWNSLGSLIEHLADLEEARRLKLLNDEFMDSGI